MAEITKEVIGTDRQLGLTSENPPTMLFDTRKAGGRMGTVGEAYQITGSAATDGANATLVTLTVKDPKGTAIAYPFNFDLWLSDNASGFSVTATTASGAVAGKTDGTTGKDLVAYIAKKALRVQTKADGTYQLSITDTSKTAFKVCAQIKEKTFVPVTLATGNYG